MFDKFTDRTRKCVSAARMHAVRLENDYVGPEHILLGLLSDRECMATKMIEDIVGNVDAVVAHLEGRIPKQTANFENEHLPLSPESKKALERAIETARQSGDNHVGTEHVLVGLVKFGQVASVLAYFGISETTLARALNDVRGKTKIADARQAILEAIYAEREYQDRKWGGNEKHPHTVSEWITIMRKVLDKADDKWMTEGNEAAFDELVKATAVGFAAMEQHGVGRGRDDF